MGAISQTHAGEGFDGSPFVGHAVKILGEHDVFDGSEKGDEMELLEDETDFFGANAVQVGGGNAGYVLAIEPNLAGRWAVEAEIRFTSEDLPDPEAPMIESHSPWVTCREM